MAWLRAFQEFKICLKNQTIYVEKTKLNPRCVTKLPILVNNGQSLTFLAPTGPGTPLLVTDGRVSAPSSVLPPSPLPPWVKLPPRRRSKKTSPLLTMGLSRIGSQLPTQRLRRNRRCLWVGKPIDIFYPFPPTLHDITVCLLRQCLFSERGHLTTNLHSGSEEINWSTRPYFSPRGSFAPVAPG